MRVGFHIYQMSFRGTEQAIFNYANFNEVLLHNKSIIFLPSNYKQHRHFATGLTFDQKTDNKFRERFDTILEYNSIDHLDQLVQESKCDVLYVLKSGENDGVVATSIPTIVHCVFCCTKEQEHGTLYAAISSSIVKYDIPHGIPIVPHICCSMPKVESNLRSMIGIPIEATVFGCYGGHETFDIDFVHEAILYLITARSDVWFIFMGIKAFCSVTDTKQRITFLPANSDIIFKSKFINTCDAMIHARSIGESFGMAIAEFTTLGKPVITWKHPGPPNKNEDTNHLFSLGETGVYYSNKETLLNILNNFSDNKEVLKNTWKPVNYSELYSPHKVIKDFDSLLLKPALTRNKRYRVQVLCNWTTSDKIHSEWSKLMSINQHSKHIELTTKNPDYTVIINSPGVNKNFIKEKSIVMGMEPDTFQGARWQWYGDKSEYMYFMDESTLNNIEWWLSLSYDKLMEHRPLKTRGDVVSSVISSQYVYPGHKLRVDFIRELEKQVNMDVYGWDNTHSFRSYRGQLIKGKDQGLFPYKYTVIAENTSRPNYFTEKLVDAILSETLCFYWGCPNVTDYLDPRCFVQLDMSNIQESIEKVKLCIHGYEWEKRVMIIRSMKERILGRYSFIPRVLAMIGFTNIEKRVINLDKRTDKWESCLSRCRQSHVQGVQRFSAIQGSDYDLNSSYIQGLFILTVNFIGPNRNPHAIIGCALSHYTLWQRVIELDKPMLIMEDDVCFQPQFVDRFGYMLDELSTRWDNDWDVVFLGWHDHEKNREYHKVPADYIETRFNMWELVPYDFMIKYGTQADASGLVGGGTHCYYLSVRGAKRLLDLVSTYKIYFPIDFFIYEGALRYGLRVLFAAHQLAKAPKFGFDTMDSDVQKLI